MNLKVNNSKGKVYYGMHMYPGVAEYSADGKDPFRIFINEDTIRSMGPSFAGRPVYAFDHVDEVPDNVDDLRKEADGWVVESFFNEADGKHWVKFIIVSERGERAIKNGLRLSNAYIPNGNFEQGGLWNGVSYAKQVTGGEYEHLAIVKNPRYEESVIMTPDEFKAYNENLKQELRKIANSKEKETTNMKLKFWNRKPAENTADLENLSVTLPKSGKEKTIIQLVNEADEIAAKNGMASDEMKVKVGENEMSVKELVENYGKMCSELEDLKKAKNEDDAEDDESLDNDESEADADAHAAEEGVENEDVEDDKDAKKKALALAKHEEAEIEAAKKKSNAKKAADKKNFDKLKNANKPTQQTVRVDLSVDQIERGRSRYGSAH